MNIDDETKEQIIKLLLLLRNQYPQSHTCNHSECETIRELRKKFDLVEHDECGTFKMYKRS